MSGKTGGERETTERIPVTVTLPPALVEQMKEFCHHCRVTQDTVVEHALMDYFREGEMSH